MEPRGSTTLFETEIQGAIREIIDENYRRGLAMILVLGFSGYEYEELVDPILTVARKGEIPVFYVNPERWDSAPKLSVELKKMGGNCIAEDCENILREIVKFCGFFEKYSSLQRQYFERGS